MIFAINQESSWNAGDLGSTPRLGRFPGEGKLPTPSSWPEEFHGLYIVLGVAKSRTQLSDFHFQYELAIGIYVSPPSWTPLPPPSPPYPSRLSQGTGFWGPASYIKLPLAISFTYGNVYVLMLFSQIIPSSSSPTESKLCALCLCLLC